MSFSARVPSALRSSPLRAVSIALGMLACVAPLAAMTLEERVACQEEVERVYWESREWPQANPGDRPAFRQAVPWSVVVRKAEDAGLRSAALAELWQRPISAEDLQAELDRIARSTRRPELLQRIFERLDGDAGRIAECLARPLLASRRLRRWYARDDRLHRDLEQRATSELSGVEDASDLRWLGEDYTELEVTRDGEGVVSPMTDAAGRPADAEERWLGAIDFLARAFELPVAPDRTEVPADVGSLPVGRVSGLREDDSRFYVVVVLEKASDRLRAGIVEWPKVPFENWWEETRGTLAPVDPLPPYLYRLPELPTAGCTEDTWSPTRAPVFDQTLQTAVWTGTEMIVWGGSPFREDVARYGGRYDPATDSWELVGTWNAPHGRRRHSAVWTGTEMIVWGGEAEGLANSNEGGRYDPATNTWRLLATAGAPSPRKYQSAVWTGDEMLVWSGCVDVYCDVFTQTGGRYDPLTDTWAPMSTGNAPDGRYGQRVVWTGSEMLVWGGWTGTASTTTGGRYHPGSDAWSDMDEGGAPSARFFHSAVWTGSRMLVWGGSEGEFSAVMFDTGGLYDPASDTWTPTSTSGAPSPRYGNSAVWTGDEMIVFGGYDGVTEVDTGGRYDPSSDAWAPTAALNAPSGRTIPVAVWTGTEMLVWGGISTTGAGLADGARYQPAGDSWVPVGLPATPTERTFHSIDWTGVEVVVWGGCGVFVDCPAETGGLYDLVTDTWQPTSLANAPVAREFHNSHWTGSEVILWGGCADAYCFVRLNDGGRYNPVTDVWTPLATVGAPRVRYWHDGVWTGTEMIVWGGCHNKDCTNTNPPLPQDGGRYHLATDTWSPTTLTNAPGGRWFLTTTWTGSEMIVWGGEDMDVGRLDTGSRYDPLSDSWTPMTTLSAPEPRTRHRAHWIGDRLLVWGGNDLATVYNSGGLYDPATDAWSPTATVGAPSGRAYPYTAWTGRELLAWGGFCDNTVECGLNDGAFYDVGTESWRPMTQVEAPLGRADSWDPVWTGSEMVVFGGTWPATLQELQSGGVYCAGETLPAAIFGDGFESGNLAAWSGSVQ